MILIMLHVSSRYPTGFILAIGGGVGGVIFLSVVAVMGLVVGLVYCKKKQREHLNKR